MDERELREQFKMLSIVDVRRFLEISDWQQASEDERAAVYEGPLTDNGQKLSVRVPTSDANVDYWDRIEDIIRLLSAVRNESLNETVRAVSLVSHDVSQIRVLNPDEQ